MCSNKIIISFFFARYKMIVSRFEERLLLRRCNFQPANYHQINRSLKNNTKCMHTSNIRFCLQTKMNLICNIVVHVAEKVNKAIESNNTKKAEEEKMWIIVFCLQNRLISLDALCITPFIYTIHIFKAEYTKPEKNSFSHFFKFDFEIRTRWFS